MEMKEFKIEAKEDEKNQFQFPLQITRQISKLSVILPRDDLGSESKSQKLPSTSKEFNTSNTSDTSDVS